MDVDQLVKRRRELRGELREVNQQLKAAVAADPYRVFSREYAEAFGVPPPQPNWIHLKSRTNERRTMAVRYLLKARVTSRNPITGYALAEAIGVDHVYLVNIFSSGLSPIEAGVVGLGRPRRTFADSVKGHDTIYLADIDLARKYLEMMERARALP